MEPVVTVGLDGTAESLAAARWAADDADRRRVTLRLMHAWILLSEEAPGVPREKDQNYWARRIVHDAQTELRRSHPNLTIIEDLVAEEASSALLRAVGESKMLVLGSRGLDTAESFFLGDTSLHIVARADGPVVLVRAGAGGELPVAREGGVVVGLGLGHPADDVVEFAFEDAAARGVPLHAVHGRRLPVGAYMPWGVDPDVAEEVAKAAQKDLDYVLGPWREKFPGVHVIDGVRLESPARAVVRAASGADLLVVGRRKHRHALAPRINHVVQAAVHHADCPVAVVPHD
ncbi:universal stress protein [Streptomyces sp. NPDC004647]|uniref:universal stress protein n=1 Tax=Streptomyces sp. NPDC004647 TaxID=3154671 RepID=UPI0033AAB5C0